jgi:iron complex outermembrane receptor protein
MRLKGILLATSAVATLWTGQALAQSTASSPADIGSTKDKPVAKSGVVVEELIVTAKQHAVDQLRDVPVAVTTFNAEERNLVGANTLADLVNLTPGVTISANGISIRGVGRETNETGTLGSVPGVAYYVNGFYKVVAGDIGESTLTSESVQFERGPQGTEFGRETIGGTASLFARHPTRDFRGEAVLQYGTNGFSGIGVNVAGPVNDWLAARFGYQHFDAEQSVEHNVGPVRAGGLAKNDYFEFQLEGQPTDKLHFWLRSTTFSYTDPAFYGAVPTYTSAMTGFSEGALSPNPLYGLTTPAPTGRNINVDDGGVDRLRAPGALPFAGVANGTFISTRYDQDYLNRVHYYTHELRLENTDKSKFSWVVGLFYYPSTSDYFYEQTDPHQPELATPTLTFSPFVFAKPNPSRAFYQQHNTYTTLSKAGFGDVLWHVNSKIDLYGGLRYSDETGHATTSVRYILFNPTFGALDVTPGTFSGLKAPAGANLSYHDPAWTGRAGIDYHFTDDALVYAKYSRGFKPGAFRVDNVTTVATNLAAPETLNAYEVGWKQRFGREVSADATAFYYDYNNLQIPLSNIGPTGTFGSAYTNLDKSRSYGLELQATWTPVTELWLNLSYSYLNATATHTAANLVDIFNPATSAGVSVNGNRLPYSPENKVSVAGPYTWTLTPGSIILGGSVAYIGSQDTDVFEDPLLKLSAATYVNLSTTFRTADNKYDFIVQASNLLNRNYVTSIVPFTFGGLSRNLGAPRFVQATLRYRW